jgi:hypothetical protein
MENHLLRPFGIDDEPVRVGFNPVDEFLVRARIGFWKTPARSFNSQGFENSIDWV